MSTFSKDFQQDLWDLMRWRRDVRRFRADPVDEAVLMRCLDAFALAPSVGLSEPWRVIRVTSDRARAAALDNFRDANARALAGYDGDRAALSVGETAEAQERNDVAEDNGMTFVDANAPDPTGDQGIAGSQKFILEDVPRLLAEAETLAGFLLEITMGFPKKNEIITFHNYSFTIEAFENKRIKQIKISIKP